MGPFDDPALWVALVGLAAGGAGIGLAVRRSRRQPVPIDPFTVNDPWRRFVQHALRNQASFDEVVAAMRPGPLRDRLSDIGGRVQAAAAECWRVARRAQAVADARKRIDADGARRALDRAGAEDPTRDALQSRLASAERLDVLLAEARERLRVLDTRLEETVSRAHELSVQQDATGAGGLGADVEDVVTELEALRLALDETNRPSTPDGT